MTRNSEILLTPVLSTHPRLITVHRSHRDDLGGEEAKYQLTATLKTNEGNYPIHIMKKKFSHEYGFIKYIEAWKAYYEAGLPVVPLLGISRKSIYMPNLRKYGWEFYGKARLKLLSNPKTAPLPVLQDKIFLNLMNDKLGFITAELEKYAKVATANQLLLPIDDPFDIGIHRNGNIQPFTLDLMQANFDTPWDPDPIARKNEKYTDMFKVKLHDLNEMMLTHKSMV